jgi:hypothetical protein
MKLGARNPYHSARSCHMRHLLLVIQMSIQVHVHSQSTKYLHYGGSNVLGYYATSTDKSVKTQNSTSLTILTLFFLTVLTFIPPVFLLH